LLRIAITLRRLPRSGGPGTYAEQLVRRLLRIDRKNGYLLIHPRQPLATRRAPAFPDYRNVQEVETRSESGLIWDQITVPSLAKRHDIDLLFSPFQRMPSWGDFKKVMVIHGAERYVVPEILGWRNLLKWRIMEWTMLPFVDGVISVSNTMTKDFCRATGFPEAKVATIYLGVDESFTSSMRPTPGEKPESYTASPRTFCSLSATSFLIRTWKTCCVASS
jgi:hypothetical protein